MTLEMRYQIVLWLLAACLKRAGGTITFYEKDSTDDQIVLLPSNLFMGVLPEAGVTVRLIHPDIMGHA